MKFLNIRIFILFCVLTSFMVLSNNIFEQFLKSLNDSFKKKLKNLAVKDKDETNNKIYLPKDAIELFRAENQNDKEALVDNIQSSLSLISLNNLKNFKDRMESIVEKRVFFPKTVEDLYKTKLDLLYKELYKFCKESKLTNFSSFLNVLSRKDRSRIYLEDCDKDNSYFIANLKNDFKETNKIFIKDETKKRIERSLEGLKNSTI